MCSMLQGTSRESSVVDLGKTRSFLAGWIMEKLMNRMLSLLCCAVLGALALVDLRAAGWLAVLFEVRHHDGVFLGEELVLG